MSCSSKFLWDVVFLAVVVLILDSLLVPADLTFKGFGPEIKYWVNLQVYTENIEGKPTESGRAQWKINSIDYWQYYFKLLLFKLVANTHIWNITVFLGWMDNGLKDCWLLTILCNSAALWLITTLGLTSVRWLMPLVRKVIRRLSTY